MPDTPISIELKEEHLDVSIENPEILVAMIGTGGEKGVGIVSIVDNYDGTFTRTYGNGATELKTSNLRGAGITEIVDNLDGTFTWYYGNHGAFITTIDLKGKNATVSLWDASGGTFPPVVLGQSGLWIISVDGTLPAPIGAVKLGDDLIWDGAIFTIVRMPAVELKTINGNSLEGSGDISISQLIGYTPYDASNPSGYISGITALMVTNALGYTPYSSSNPAGYISGITSLMVTNALGFTPYSSANPSGYISVITSLMVTTALGFTPYSNANPSNFISLLALSAGTGISYDNTTGTISNTAPDQVVALTAGTNISISGTYPNFTINASGGATTADVVAMLTVGGINSGETVPAGTTITQLVQDLLLTTFYPTFSAPTFSLTSNQANGQEVGTIVTNTLTYNFNRGSINGKLVGGIWQPATFQDYRAGAASNYVIDGTNEGLTNVKTISSYALLTTQTYSGTVTYGVGPQATDSDGANYSTPLVGGTNTQSVTITAIYPRFYGKVNGGSKPSKEQALINLGTKVVGSSTGTITVSFNSAASDWLWFAIPQTSTSKTKWYIDALNNGSIGGISNLFDTESVVAIDSPTVLWNGINYKIYVSNYQSAVSSSMQLQN